MIDNARRDMPGEEAVDVVGELYFKRQRFPNEAHASSSSSSSKRQRFRKGGYSSSTSASSINKQISKLTKTATHTNK